VAEVSDAESDLRALARRIPDDIRASLSKTEMHLRLTEAANLLADAETAGSEVKADRLRARAGLVLKAATPDSYAATMRVLGDELKAAELDGDTRRALEIQGAMQRFDRRNPQVSEETLMTAAYAAVSRMKLPPIPPPEAHSRSALTRRFGRKPRKR
jgi:beta-glucosidase-like glycosyl hydrolase